LFKVAQNLIIDGFRKQLGNPVFESYLDYRDKLASGGEDVEQKMDFDLFVKRLEVAKKQLTPRQREIFELSKEQGVPVSEIAARLHLTEQTVYNQLSVAMQTLRKNMKVAFCLLFCLFFDIM
jgi:RNA polymerase sigma-70 factor (ECF subfamily)